MKKKILAIAALLAAGFAVRAAPAMSPEDRTSYRFMLLLNLPNVPQFDEWIHTSDELPPDFDALPRHNALPDPLTFADGKPVKTAADWPARRAEILALYQKYVWGSIPPHPKYDHAVVQDVAGPGYRTRMGSIYVGPEAKGVMRITLQIPDGKGPFPVVLGPGLIAGIGGGGGGAGAGANAIRAHGYIVASFADNNGNDESANIAALYPKDDPGTLPRRAWAASTVLDYLETMPEVDPKRIAITGYLRDGKMATIAAALDGRIAAVLAGSPGVGGILPFRLAGERNQAESIQSTTMMFPDWFHPRLRYFAGREDRLPVDGNLLLAAIAPRPFFLVAGINDVESDNWGDEQSFHSAQKAYDLLGAKDKLGLLRVPGYHGANDGEQALTWLDIQFGKSDKKWTNDWMFPWDFEQWKKAYGETVDLSKYPDRRGAELLKGDNGAITTTAAWEAKAAGVRKNMEWMLGEGAGANVPYTLPARAPQQDVPAMVIRASVGREASEEFGWPPADNANAATRAVSFNAQRGEVKGTLYYPKNAAPGAKLPTVIWLHSYSYPLGYMWVYHREVHPILALVDNGYAVLAYDQSGFGSRMDESSAAWQGTFPHWSQMGHMVEDARAAVDTLAKDPAVNPKGIYLFGYGMGANVALYTAALEPKVAGVVSVCGFTPMRTDTTDKGTGGIARYSLERPLIPRLGFFIGNEAKIPYDYDEMLAAIAPRPVFVLNPLYDRDATFKDVHDAAESARQVYGLYHADDKLRLDEPWDYNRLAGYTQDRIIIWMRENMK